MTQTLPMHGDIGVSSGLITYESITKGIPRYGRKVRSYTIWAPYYIGLEKKPLGSHMHNSRYVVGSFCSYKAIQYDILFKRRRVYIPLCLPPPKLFLRLSWAVRKARKLTPSRSLIPNHVDEIAFGHVELSSC